MTAPQTDPVAKKLLVAYATMAGSTAEVAQAVGEVLAASGLQVEVFPIDALGDLQGYDAVVVGAPMIMGWHRSALRFLRRNRDALKRVPLAIFVTAMSLTETGESSVDGVALTVDPRLFKSTRTSEGLGLRERYATLANYCRPILRAARPARPVSIGVFAGRLEYGRLKWWAVVFAMVIVQAAAGDRRNWEAIRGWAASLPTAFDSRMAESA